MNRLAAELHRLYQSPAPGSTRVLRFEVAAPADWAALGRVWRGVQADFALPAPAIAVSGTDGLQLWFSLLQPLPLARAAEVLARLQQRYLPDMPPGRLRLRADDGLPPVPVQDAASGNWSAFIAPDLAPVFAETPWLDIPPGADGQADLLARLDSTPPAALDAALQALQPAAPVATPATAVGNDIDPRQFLQQVLNDAGAPLDVRVEAAKALLLRA